VHKAPRQNEKVKQLVSAENPGEKYRPVKQVENSPNAIRQASDYDRQQRTMRDCLRDLTITYDDANIYTHVYDGCKAWGEVAPGCN
jgi:hypothetical protein